MKKLLYLVAFFFIFMTGCEKNTTVPAPAELFLLSGDTTSSGVSIGDGARIFQEAYHDYEILVSRSADEIPNEPTAIRRIPYKEEITTMIANFFINGKPMTAEQLCKEEEVSMDSLTSLISSPSFLQKHEVLYRYLLFYWKDGKITKIESEELNYNETFEVPSETP